MFKKKEKTIVQRTEAVQERLSELRKQMDAKQKGIAEAQANLSRVLGDLALANTPQNQDAVKRAKKVLSMHTNGLGDLKLMLALLENEQKSLATEGLKATVRESPDKLKDLAREFNKTLGKALSKLQELKTLHTDLSNSQVAFYGLLRERQLAVSSLGIMAPLSLEEGLGELAGDNIPTPFRSTAQIPDNESAFLNSLIDYRDRLASWESYQANNPNWKEREVALAEAPRQVGGIGEMASPTRHQEFKEVFVPPAR